MKKPTITAVIIAKNEEKMLEACLKTLNWCEQVIMVDNGSVDKTAVIAENFGAKVISFAHRSFARLREEGLKRVKTDWVFYIDADERVTPLLAKEIAVKLETCPVNALRLKRTNICYGKEFKYGGWEKDYVTRIFKTQSLKGWQGDIHESPVFDGKAADLATALIHLTHRNTTNGLKKTVEWTKIEAELLYKANVSKVTFWTLVRKGLMEFFRRTVVNKGYQDGLEGVIEAVVQGINKILIYIQVWELQQKPSLEEKYDKQEFKIKQLWQKEK